MTGYDPFKEGVKITLITRSNGKDVFGNKSATITTLKFDIISGKLITKSSDSRTTSKDLLGNTTISRSIVTYNYSTTKEEGKLIYNWIKTETWSEGSDLYGGTWKSDGYTM